MHILLEDLHWPIKIHIDRHASRSFSTNLPHSEGRISERTSMVRQALFIRYLADHCVSLRMLSIAPDLVKNDGARRPRMRGQVTAPRVTQPIVLALAALAVKCGTLEAIITRPTEWRTPAVNSMLRDIIETGPWVERVIVLKNVPS
jgi:hypothetical protein